MREVLFYALKGSVSRSGAWAPVVGALLLWSAVALSGYEIVIPSTVPGGIALFILFAVAAWVLIFLGRMVYAPYRFWHEQRARVQGLNDKLARISEERPLTYVTSNFTVNGNNFHQRPTWAVERVEFVFENTGDRMLAYKFINAFIEVAGNQVEIPVKSRELTFIHPKQQMSYGFDVSGLTAQVFPVVIDIGFNVEYDNHPPLRARRTRRVIRYTFRSFQPMLWSNVIRESAEE